MADETDTRLCWGYDLRCDLFRSGAQYPRLRDLGGLGFDSGVQVQSGPNIASQIHPNRREEDCERSGPNRVRQNAFLLGTWGGGRTDYARRMARHPILVEAGQAPTSQCEVASPSLPQT